MTSRTNHIKSPFLAGFFGLIPGFGHFYSGNFGKSVLLSSLLLLPLFLWFYLQQPFSVNRHSMELYSVPSDTFVFLWLGFLMPLFVIYSVSDAVVSVLKHNRRILFGTEQIQPPPPQQMEWNKPEQDILRQGARERGMPI